jgi:Fic family protein
MDEAMESLSGFIRSAHPLPPLIRLALVHYQFEVIHPFYDANGRVGRLINSLLLCRWGLVPGPVPALSPYLLRRADAYPELLGRVSRENAVEDWLLFFLQGILEQAQEAEGVLAELEAMRADFFARVAAERTADRLERVIELALVRPYLNVGQVAAALPDGNFKSAARAVARLVELGVLEEITGQKRHRVFRAGEWVARLTEVIEG